MRRRKNKTTLKTRVTKKQGAAPFNLPKAIVEPSSLPLHRSSTSPSVNDVGLIVHSVIVSGSQSCESASCLVGEQVSFPGSQVSSLLEAQHNEQAALAQQCLHPDSQTLHIQQEQPQAVSSQTLAASDGLHLDVISRETILGTTTNLELEGFNKV